VSLTLLCFLNPRRARDVPAVPAGTLLLLRTLPTAETRSTPLPPALSALPRAAPWPVPAIALARPEHSAAAATIGSAISVWPTAPQSPASAPLPPLRLDAPVLRQAARDSLSETRRLAAAAGQSIDSADGQRLAGDVAAAGKPACLGADAGGSLLSIPIIAYRMLRQTCR
jgi:hypothetical protein